jgi:hypothetical protein
MYFGVSQLILAFGIHAPHKIERGPLPWGLPENRTYGQRICRASTLETRGSFIAQRCRVMSGVKEGVNTRGLMPDA